MISIPSLNENNFSKEKLFKHNMMYMLNRLQSMFVYKGLPETIPEQELEGILFKHGSAFITDHEGELYAFDYSPVNNLDVYGNFTQVNVSNVALNIGKVYDVETGVICDNDYMRMGLFPLVEKYSYLLAENTITLKNVDIMLRIVELITASDDITKASADEYLKKLRKGDMAIIGANPIFDGIKVQNSNNGLQNYLHQFLEYEQYLKGSFFNELGLNANFNLKNERLSANETALNRDFLHPLVDNMKECREKFCHELNVKYGLKVSVDFGSSWKTEEVERENEEATVLNHETINAPRDDIEPSPPENEPEKETPADEVDTQQEETSTDDKEEEKETPADDPEGKEEEKDDENK